MIWIAGGLSSRREELFFYPYANVQRLKRGIFTADIYSYLKIEFDYAKRDSFLAEYRAVVLQRFKSTL